MGLPTMSKLKQSLEEALFELASKKSDAAEVAPDRVFPEKTLRRIIGPALRQNRRGTESAQMPKAVPAGIRIIEVAEDIMPGVKPLTRNRWRIFSRGKYGRRKQKNKYDSAEFHTQRKIRHCAKKLYVENSNMLDGCCRCQRRET